MKFKYLALALAITSMSLTACGDKKSAGNVIKIAASAPLTGSSADAGADHNNGAQLAVDEINANDAAKIVMKSLYGARFVRYDCPRPIGNLARRVSCWSKDQDRRLHRLISHINSTQDVTLQSFVGDHTEDCSVLLCCHASLADDLRISTLHYVYIDV